MDERIGIAGSFDSNDCLVTIKKADKLTITIDSIVKDYFYEAILDTVKKALEEKNISKDSMNISVEVQDKGALDFTIRARVLTALKRYEKGGNK